MSQPIISVEGLGKRYFLSHQKRHDTLRDSLTQTVRGFFQRDSATTPAGSEEFWALRDVSFQLNQGEVIGVIGRNGAGKSTLLKILSRIAEPTTGRAVIRGRIASLLEVGTGFHPELSGRENIFLNGAILGMARAEIARKFDEIVAFAEVERFLDTQVKHYSSGMYVRLAFAVAAHLEPEILIVDEVLAVGDAQFQKKCLGKMKTVAADEGRTVIFVSHNMSVVHSLCRRVLLLEKGRIALDGSAGEATQHYLSSPAEGSFVRPVNPTRRATITGARVEITGPADAPSVEIQATLSARTPLRAAFEVRLLDVQGMPVAFGSLGAFDPDRQLALPTGNQSIRCRFSAAGLANGSYRLSLVLSLPFAEVIDQADGLLAFELTAAPAPGTSHRIRQDWGLGYSVFPLESLQ